VWNQVLAGGRTRRGRNAGGRLMFQETILQMNNGATVAELSEALEKVVAAVRAAGKTGSITLTIKVAPASKGNTDVLMVESQVRTRLPEPDRGMTIFFATTDNRLVRNDPKQQMLPLKIVDIDQQHKDLKEVI
jgi:hypothetical protein